MSQNNRKYKKIQNLPSLFWPMFLVVFDVFLTSSPQIVILQNNRKYRINFFWILRFCLKCFTVLIDVPCGLSFPIELHRESSFRIAEVSKYFIVQKCFQSKINKEIESHSPSTLSLIPSYITLSCFKQGRSLWGVFVVGIFCF